MIPEAFLYIVDAHPPEIRDAQMEGHGRNIFIPFRRRARYLLALTVDCLSFSHAFRKFILSNWKRRIEKKALSMRPSVDHSTIAQLNYFGAWNFVISSSFCSRDYILRDATTVVSLIVDHFNRDSNFIILASTNFYIFDTKLNAFLAIARNNLQKKKVK